MKIVLKTLAVLALCTASPLAGEPENEPARNPVSLLPDGSVLKDVLIPRYDDRRRLVGDLSAGTMTLVSPQRIRGENVLIRFYRPDRSLRGKVKLLNAILDQTNSRLRAREPVELTNDRLHAKGTGLVFAFQDGTGFLRGPATTRISARDTSTSMHPGPARQKTSLLALCLSPVLPLVAAPPPFVSPAELERIQAEARSKQAVADAFNRQTSATLERDIAAATRASQAATRFIETSGIPPVDEKTTPPAPPAEPLQVNPGPGDTVIECDGGMYFDSDAGILVYFKNVSVTDPRFNLSGANELKIFFEKKETGKKKKNPGRKTRKIKKMRPFAAAANFGDVRKLVATGTVRLLQQGVDGREPVEASGGILTYDVPEGEIIISQRYPWVKQGDYFARAKQPDLTLRLLNNGSFSTEGNWQVGGDINFDND